MNWIPYPDTVRSGMTNKGVSVFLPTKNYQLKNRQGFTLIELMVTIGILCVVVVMIGGLVNFTVGRLKSNQLRNTNDAVRSALNIIGQKMYNANDTTNVGTTTVYGFKKIGEVLTIVSSGSNNVKTCTYFALNSEKIMMDQSTGCEKKGAGELTNSVTPDKIIVDHFTLSESSPMTGPTATNIPKVTIIVDAHDISDPAVTQTELQTTFTMDYENVNYLNN